MNKSWIKVYQLILWIVTLVIIVGALMYHTSSLSFGKGKEVSDKLEYEGTVSNVDINADLFDIDIVYGDKLQVEYSCNEKIEPVIEYSNGKLCIKQKKSNAIGFGFDGLGKVMDCKLIVTLPKDSDIKSMKMDVDCGDIDIIGIKCASLKIDADCGDVDIDGIKAEDINIDADTGSVSLKNCEATMLDANADAGEIKVNSSKIEKVELKANVGNIKAEGEFAEVKADCDIGDVDIINSNKEAKYKVDCDLGKASVNGEDW